jgi:hypothetical protein
LILNGFFSFNKTIGIKKTNANTYRKVAPVNDPKTWAAIRVAMNVPPHINATKISLM